jgi:RNA polymerase sigma-70 factor (ECF subfamily)
MVKVADFRAFYMKYRDGLFAYLVRSTADYDRAGDVLQESFTRLLEKYGEDQRNPSLLYAIARNAVVDGYRKNGRHTAFLEEQQASDLDTESQLLVREDYRRMLAAMQELAQEERDLLSLVVSSGLRYSEIAAITGISEANVKVKVHRARLKLKKILRADDK